MGVKLIVSAECLFIYRQMADLHLHRICQLIVAQPDINSFNLLRFRTAFKYIPILESCPVARGRKRAHVWDLTNVQRGVRRERSSSYSIVRIYISGKGRGPLHLSLEAAQAKTWNEFINVDRVETYAYVLMYKK